MSALGVAVAARTPTVATRRRIRAGLALYGVAAAVLAAWHLAGTIPDQAELMGTRELGVERSLATLEDGGPPLLWAAPSWHGADPPTGTSYVDLGSDDDPGLYLYLPLVGHALGVDDPLVLVKWFFIAFFVFIPAVYPLVFFELFGSVLAAFAAPLLALWQLSFLDNHQLYWVGAWAVLFCLPILMLVATRPWRRSSAVAVVAAAAIAGVCTSLRGLGGLPVLAASLITVAYALRPWHRAAIVGLIVVAAYAGTAQGVVEGARQYRDHVAGRSIPQSHTTPWHNFYIGLSYLENPYGIIYRDGVAAEAAKRVDPDVEYLDEGYPAAMRGAVARLWHQDPWFIVDNLRAKTRASVRDALDVYWPVLVIVPLMLALGARRADYRRWLVLTLPAFPIFVMPPVLVLPIESYELAWLGAWALLWFLGVFWLVAGAERVVLDRAFGSGEAIGRRLGRTARELGPRAARTSSSWLAAVGAAAAVAIALVPPPARPVAGRSIASLSSPLTAVASTGTPLKSWEMTGALAPGWTTTVGTSVSPLEDGIAVRTTKSTTAYQLLSPQPVLPAGSYSADVRGVVRRGAILLGVLDVEQDRWIAQTLYSDGQSFAGKAMVTPFALTGPTKVQVILANLADPAAVSRWEIRVISIDRG